MICHFHCQYQCQSSIYKRPVMCCILQWVAKSKVFSAFLKLSLQFRVHSSSNKELERMPDGRACWDDIVGLIAADKWQIKMLVTGILIDANAVVLWRRMSQTSVDSQCSSAFRRCVTPQSFLLVLNLLLPSRHVACQWHFLVLQQGYYVE